jgi:alkanesulfonate monooxygenase SsuD/methylene tetrahydromethanopterin reductase-like flavin-dependent oxidoreductase (luciferase family)
MPAGSAETIEFAAERRIPIARVWSPTAVFQDAFEYYKEVAQERFGWVAGPEHCIGSRYIHIAETTEQAIAECRDAVMYVRRLTTFSRPVQVPAAVPGIQTDRSFEYRKRSRGAEMPAPGTPFEKLREPGFIVCGDPDYVTEWLAQDMQTAGYGHFLGMFRVGSNAHQNVIKSKRMFAEYVMPRLRHINETSPPTATEPHAARPPVAG